MPDTSLNLLQATKELARETLHKTLQGRTDLPGIEETFDNAFDLIEHYIKTEGFLLASQIGEALQYSYEKIEEMNRNFNADYPARFTQVSEKNALVFNAIAHAMKLPSSIVDSFSYQPVLRH